MVPTPEEILTANAQAEAFGSEASVGDSREQLMLMAMARVKLRILAAREDPVEFISFVLRSPKGETLIPQGFHREWLQLFTDGRRVQIEAAKSHGKTTSLLGLILWLIGRNPDIRIKLFAQSEEKARERVSVVANTILSSKLYQLVFPHIKKSSNIQDPWHKTGITVERNIKDPNATLEGSGITGSVEGGRADLVVLDDVCLPTGSLIVTKRGLLPIETVVPGDWVRNHEGTWSRVGKVMTRQVQRLRGLRASGLADWVYMTDVHPVYCRREASKVRSKKLVKNSQFVAAADISNNVNRRRWFLASAASNAHTLSDADLQSIWAEHELPPGTRGQHKDATRLTNPLGSNQFWWLVGLWLAEGWTREQKLKTGRNYTTWFSLNSCEEGTIARLRRVAWATLRRRLSVQPDGKKNAVRCIISDKALKNFLAAFRREDGTKECPWWIYDLPVDYARSLVAGYWTGDGSISGDHFRVGSTSLPLLAQMRTLLARLGVTAGIANAREQRKWPGKPFREMSIDGTFARKVLLRTDWPEPRHTNSVFDNDELLRPVQETHVKTGNFTVHNLQMDKGPHSYESLGLVSHNCDHRSSMMYPLHRAAIVKKCYAEILPMLEADGRAISIATPHHDADLVASLRRNTEWDAHVYAVGGMAENGEDDPFKPLWPDRWSRQALEKLMAEVGVTEYNRAYRCQAQATRIEIVKPEHIAYYDRNMLGDPWNLICLQAYDLAIADKKGASFFACVTLLYNAVEDLIFVADAWQDHLDFAAQAQAIVQQAATWNPDRIVLEETGYQRALREYLQDIARSTLPLWPVSPGNKSKELRLTETLPLFETERIFFNPSLRPDSVEVQRRGDLITQLINFTMASDQDLGDAFAHAVNSTRAFREAYEEGVDWRTGGGVSTRLSILGR